MKEKSPWPLIRIFIVCFFGFFAIAGVGLVLLMFWGFNRGAADPRIPVSKSAERREARTSASESMKPVIEKFVRENRRLPNNVEMQKLLKAQPAGRTGGMVYDLASPTEYAFRESQITKNYSGVQRTVLMKGEVDAALINEQGREMLAVENLDAALHMLLLPSQWAHTSALQWILDNQSKTPKKQWLSAADRIFELPEEKVSDNHADIEVKFIEALLPRLSSKERIALSRKAAYRPSLFKIFCDAFQKENDLDSLLYYSLHYDPAIHAVVQPLVESQSNDEQLIQIAIRSLDEAAFRDKACQILIEKLTTEKQRTKRAPEIFAVLTGQERNSMMYKANQPNFTKAVEYFSDPSACSQMLGLAKKKFTREIVNTIVEWDQPETNLKLMEAIASNPAHRDPIFSYIWSNRSRLKIDMKTPLHTLFSNKLENVSPSARVRLVQLMGERGGNDSKPLLEAVDTAGNPGLARTIRAAIARIEQRENASKK